MEVKSVSITSIIYKIREMKLGESVLSVCVWLGYPVNERNGRNEMLRCEYTAASVNYV